MNDETPHPPYDLGHRGDFDYTQIAHMLEMTPLERLRHHERWRVFVKEMLKRAELRGGSASSSDGSKG